MICTFPKSRYLKHKPPSCKIPCTCQGPTGITGASSRRRQRFSTSSPQEKRCDSASLAEADSPHRAIGEKKKKKRWAHCDSVSHLYKEAESPHRAIGEEKKRKKKGGHTAIVCPTCTKCQGTPRWCLPGPSKKWEGEGATAIVCPLKKEVWEHRDGVSLAFDKAPSRAD